MGNPQISIIANFYNSEKFIPQLIKSVLKQSYEDWELIAVNDCSPGNDLKILQKWKKHPNMKGRMRILNNEKNLGISFAKAQGITVAKGKYLTFIDGDDWLEPLALEKMIEPAENFDLDLVIGNHYHVIKKIYRRICSSKEVNFREVYCPKRIKAELYKNFFGINLYNLGYWGKMIKLSTLKESKYIPQKTTLYEDVFFNFELLKVCNKLMFIEYPVYNYRWGGISSSSTNKSEISFSTFGIIKNFNDFYFKRLNIINKYDFPQGLEPLRIELYNVLRSSLDKICAPAPNTKEGEYAKKRVIESVSLPAYREILELRGNPYIRDQRFFDALENKDIDWLYNFFHEIYKKGWKKRLVRKILSKFC